MTTKTLVRDNRDCMFDNIKIMLIFFVIIGHTLDKYEGNQSYYIWTSLLSFVNAFHMPMFVFVSGYFSKNLSKARVTAFDKCLIMFLVANFTWKIFIGLTNGNLAVMQDFFQILNSGWALWYLASLFFWRLMLKDLIRVKHIVIISFIVGLLMLYTPQAISTLSFTRTITLLPFFLLGFYTNTNLIEKLRSNKKIVFLAFAIIIAVFIGCVINAKLDIMPYETFIHYWTCNEYKEVYSGYKENKFVLLVFSAFTYAVSVMMIYAIIAIMPSKKNKITHLGTDTMPIYLGHTYIVTLATLAIADITIFKENILVYLAFTFVLAVGIIYICSRKCVKTFVYDYLETGRKLILKKEFLNSQKDN